jgi:hypothetical protein
VAVASARRSEELAAAHSALEELVTQQRGATPEPARPSFRTTLVRVLVVQVVALTLLGVIQIVYGGR